MADRRPGGILVLVIVALAAVGVPAVAGRSTGQAAVRAPAAAAPAVGACLGTLPDLGPSTIPPAAAPSVTLVPCDRPHVGEVVAVTSGPGRCFQAMTGYLGLPASGLVLGWKVRLNAGATAFGPDVAQRADGQSWTGCAVTPGASGPNPLQYNGIVRNALAGGRPPAGYALCTPSIGSMLGQGTASCAAAHGAEVLGNRSTADPALDQPALDASCAALAVQLTGSADPTRGGQLRVTAYGYHFDRFGTPRPGLDHAGTSGATCVLTAEQPDRQLDDTLLGLGSGPVPWQ
jgi:hypothetical protein